MNLKGRGQRRMKGQGKGDNLERQDLFGDAVIGHSFTVQHHTGAPLLQQLGHIGSQVRVLRRVVLTIPTAHNTTIATEYACWLGWGQATALCAQLCAGFVCFGYSRLPSLGAGTEKVCSQAPRDTTTGWSLTGLSWDPKGRRNCECP